METINILFADDDKERTNALRRGLTLRKFRQSLGKVNLNVIETQNAEDAMKALEDSSFQLVVTDLKMPTLTGHHVAIKASKNPDCIVILNSDSGNNSEDVKNAIGKEIAQIPETVRIMTKQEVTIELIQEIISSIVTNLRNQLGSVLKQY